MNLYSNPEKFGLTVVGEVDWSDGNYNFDITAVYRRVDGHLAYAEDAGCSCPSPFEDQGVDDLTACTPAELQSHLEERGKAVYYRNRAAEVADLMAKVTA